MNEVLKIAEPVGKPPRAIFAPVPIYTKAARNAQIEGNVHLGVMLDEHGVPQQAWIDKSLDSGLDESSFDTVKKRRFDSSREDSKPVAVKIDVAVNFKLY